MNNPHVHPRLRVAADLPRSSDIADALDQVRAARVDPDAERHRHHLLEFCTEHPDVLYRSCERGHLTGSAAVMQEGTGRLALLLHAKIGRWLQPGGHADGEADLARVALDEASEETGLVDLRVAVPAIDVDVHVFDAPSEPRHLHFDLRFLVVAPEGADLIANHESRDLRWFARDQLAGLDLDSGTHRLFDRAKWMAGELGLLK